MSVREARAGFAAALSAAENGERVTITRNGKPVAELGPPPAPAKPEWDWDELERTRVKLGIEKPDYPLDEAWRESFDDPSWTRELFGPEYFDDLPTGSR